MPDITLSAVLTELGVNGPFAFVIWLLFKDREKLSKERDEARKNERAAERSLLDLYQKAAQKAGIHDD